MLKSGSIGKVFKKQTVGFQEKTLIGAISTNSTQHVKTGSTPNS